MAREIDLSLVVPNREIDFPFSKGKASLKENLIKVSKAAEALGYQRLLFYDHIIPSAIPGGNRGVTASEMYLEPLVVSSFVAAVTDKIKLAPCVLILPWREPVVTAKQIGVIDAVSGGRFELAVGGGSNRVEFEGIGVDMHTRGKIVEEDLALMQALFANKLVTYKDKRHNLLNQGINPNPGRKLFTWMGGWSEPVLQRIAKMADGWMIMNTPNSSEGGYSSRDGIIRLKELLDREGRSADQFPIMGSLGNRRFNGSNDIDGDFKMIDEWRKLGVKYIACSSQGHGFNTISEHLRYIENLIRAIDRE
jgi:probable F420-dependent oxidoreductase